MDAGLFIIKEKNYEFLRGLPGLQVAYAEAAVMS